MRRSVVRLVLVVLLSLLPRGPARGEPSEPGSPELLTLAEQSGFRATPSYRQTLDFIERLARRWPAIRLEYFGVSPQGRPMPVVVVSKDPETSPSNVASSGKAVILVQNGIHGGEIDGKDASLMILRDLALGRHRELLDSLVLLIVPIYNVDGHERISRFNRPNQNGPVAGMGFRTTADGHDLNRDHLKLETPEARAMIGLFNTWKPHLHVDNHVTDGVDHDWVLTWTWVEAPQLAPSLDRWTRQHLTAALEATERAGHRVGPYVALFDRDDPSAGFDSYVGQARFATGYYPLRNRPSVLVENHSYKPYRDRVLANRDFLLALFAEAASGRQTLIDAVREAESRTVAAGRADAPPSEIVLDYEVEPATETIRFPVYVWERQPSVVLGTPLARYRSGEVAELEVPWSHRPRPRLSIARPRAYVVMPGWPVIERRLQDHGLRVLRISEPAELQAETIRVSTRAGDEPSPTYQGLTRLEVDVERSRGTQPVPAGALWIPADQPDFEVAVQLLEPEAPDSLVRWGLLSTVMERKEYIDPRVLEEMAVEMLEATATREAWEKALEEEAFSRDPQARWTWWYRRTKYWDETVGLMPVLRVVAAATPTLEPWPGPAWSAEPPAQLGRLR